jgi:hypothetical protein
VDISPETAAMAFFGIRFEEYTWLFIPSLSIAPWNIMSLDVDASKELVANGILNFVAYKEANESNR